MHNVHSGRWFERRLREGCSCQIRVKARTQASPWKSLRSSQHHVDSNEDCCSQGDRTHVGHIAGGALSCRTAREESVRVGLKAWQSGVS